MGFWGGCFWICIFNCDVGLGCFLWIDEPEEDILDLTVSCAFFAHSDATFNCSVMEIQLRWNLTVFITLTPQKFQCESRWTGCRHVLAPLHLANVANPPSFALQTVGTWLLLICSSLLLCSNLLTESIKFLKLSLVILNLMSWIFFVTISTWKLLF